jgi:hypothetical protein
MPLAMAIENCRQLDLSDERALIGFQQSVLETQRSHARLVFLVADVSIAEPGRIADDVIHLTLTKERRAVGVFQYKCPNGILALFDEFGGYFEIVAPETPLSIARLLQELKPRD